MLLKKKSKAQKLVLFPVFTFLLNEEHENSLQKQY